MKHQILALAFLSLFAWNTVFGGVGGLLLCLHQNLELHPELISAEDSDRKSTCNDPSAKKTCLSGEESCLDVELKAVELPEGRIDEDQSLAHYNSDHRATHEIAEQNFSLRQIAHIVEAQAPPDLLDASVLVARTINLRL